MALERRQFGFWRNVANMSSGQLIGLEGAVSGAVGVTGAIWIIHVSDVNARVAIVGDFVALGSALIGVVFAGFALVVSLLSDKYLVLLQTSSSQGLVGFLAPFIVNIGALVFVVVTSVAYRASAVELPEVAEKVAFGTLAVLFLYAALNMVALARSVLAHGATRAELAVTDELERKLRQRPDDQERGA